MSVAQTTAEQEIQPEVAPHKGHAQAGQKGGHLSADQVHTLSAQAEGKTPQKRTPGLKFVDGAVYAGVTHFGVFAISVVFTYLTRHGHTIGGKFPNAMHSRNEKFIGFLTKRGISRQAASDFSVVTWSFLDGCLLLPLVRALETQRTRIAYAVDKVMGKVPKKTLPDGKVVDDMSIYEKEPPQSWASVIIGRVAAAGMVVPVAMALDKWTPSQKRVKLDEQGKPIMGPSIKDGKPELDAAGNPVMKPVLKNFNDIVMRDFGYSIADKIQDKAAGKWIVNKANSFFEKRHGRLSEGQTKAGLPLKPDTPYKLKLREFMEVNVFETVWTAICTAVLYTTSRGAAKMLGARKEKKAEAAQAQPHAGGEKPAEHVAHQAEKHEEKAAQPAHQATHKEHQAPHKEEGKPQAQQHTHAAEAQPAQKPEKPSAAKLTPREEMAWAEFVGNNPDLAKEVARTIEDKLKGTQLERVEQRRSETALVGAAGRTA